MLPQGLFSQVRRVTYAGVAAVAKVSDAAHGLAELAFLSAAPPDVVLADTPAYRFVAEWLPQSVGHWPAALAPAVDRIAADLPAIAAELCPTGVLCHGDVHAGNLFFPASGPARLIDWPNAHNGCAAEDVARLLASSLTPELRRAHEDALLERCGVERSDLRAAGWWTPALVLAVRGRDLLRGGAWAPMPMIERMLAAAADWD